jgi:hypothetical protein
VAAILKANPMAVIADFPRRAKKMKMNAARSFLLD